MRFAPLACASEALAAVGDPEPQKSTEGSFRVLARISQFSVSDTRPKAKDKKNQKARKKNKVAHPGLWVAPFRAQTKVDRRHRAPLAGYYPLEVRTPNRASPLNGFARLAAQQYK